MNFIIIYYYNYNTIIIIIQNINIMNFFGREGLIMNSNYQFKTDIINRII